MLGFEGLENGPLVHLRIEAYVIFLVIIGLAMGLTYWGMAVAERKRRAAFLDGFDPSELQVNRYRKTVVYHVLEETEGRLKAVSVWRGKYPEKQGEIIEADKEHFIDFESDRFVAKG